MKDYKILAYDNAVELAENVRLYMEDQWDPIGGVSVLTENHQFPDKDTGEMVNMVKTFFYQAMVYNVELEVVSPNPSRKKKPRSVEDYQKKVQNWKAKFNKFSEYSEAFPIVNIKAELNRAALWLYTNPAKRKQKFDRFFNTWCTREQEKGIPRNAPMNNPKIEDL